MQNSPTIHRLACPVHCGDWHDKPLKWQVNWPGHQLSPNGQRFSTKKDAITFARLWKKAGGDEMEAGREFAAM